MTTPINGSLLRAKQFAPQFAGTQPDAEVSQAHALIGIGEILTMILSEMVQARLAQENTFRAASRQSSPRRTPSRVPAMTFDE